MNQAQIRQLFPTPVLYQNIQRPLTTEEMSLVENIEYIENKQNHRTKRSDILELEELQDIKSFILHNLGLYFEEVWKPENNVELYITQSWCNKCHPGESHHKHTHSNSFISGVFYFKADPEVDRIVFSKDIYENIQIDQREYNPWNSSSWWYEVGQGDLILFPSSTIHHVDKVYERDTRDNRISLSFNTFIKGTIGNEFNLSELSL